MPSAIVAVAIPTPTTIQTFHLIVFHAIVKITTPPHNPITSRPGFQPIVQAATRAITTTRPTLAWAATKVITTKPPIHLMRPHSFQLTVRFAIRKPYGSHLLLTTTASIFQFTVAIIMGNGNFVPTVIQRQVTTRPLVVLTATITIKPTWMRSTVMSAIMFTTVLPVLIAIPTAAKISTKHRQSLK